MTVSYWYERHEDGVRVDVCESVIDFMKKLILHVPDDQFKMIRYYGVYASVKKKTRALVKVMTQRLFPVSLFKKNWRSLLIHTFHHDPLLCKCGHYIEFLECYVPRRKTMLMETEYIKMKCKRCGYEEWAEEEIADELATYNRKTKKYEILLECPECHGVMIWYNKEKKVEQWESGFDPDDLPF